MPPKPQTRPQSQNHPLLSALLDSILQLLGPSLWALYRQLIRNILSNWEDCTISELSVETLFRLLQARPVVAYRHNDIARAMRTDDGVKIPPIKLWNEIPAEVTQEYWSFCNDIFGGSVTGLRKWTLLVEAGEKVAGPKKAPLARKRVKVAPSPFLPFFDGPEMMTGEGGGKDLKKMIGEENDNFIIRVANDERQRWEMQLFLFLEKTQKGKDPVSQHDIQMLLIDNNMLLEDLPSGSVGGAEEAA